VLRKPMWVEPSDVSYRMMNISAP